MKLENHFDEMIVKELLAEPFSTVAFPGYKNIDIPFMTLEAIMRKDTQAWKNALSIKGIYLITDTKTGKNMSERLMAKKEFGSDGVII